MCSVDSLDGQFSAGGLVNQPQEQQLDRQPLAHARQQRYVVPLPAAVGKRSGWQADGCCQADNRVLVVCHCRHVGRGAVDCHPHNRAAIIVCLVPALQAQLSKGLACTWTAADSLFHYWYLHVQDI